MAPPSAQTTQRGLTQKVSLIVALVVFEIGGFWDQDNTKRSIFCICRSQLTSKINQFLKSWAINQEIFSIIPAP
jgi:hypothetical protein